MRGGIGLTASFTYQVTLDLAESYLLPQGPHEFCIRLLHGWPDNKISIYVYYQIRSIKMCKAHIPYVSNKLNAFLNFVAIFIFL